MILQLEFKKNDVNILINRSVAWGFVSNIPRANWDLKTQKEAVKYALTRMIGE